MLYKLRYFCWSSLSLSSWIDVYRQLKCGGEKTISFSISILWSNVDSIKQIKKSDIYTLTIELASGFWDFFSQKITNASHSLVESLRIWCSVDPQVKGCLTLFSALTMENLTIISKSQMLGPLPPSPLPNQQSYNAWNKQLHNWQLQKIL